MRISCSTLEHVSKKTNGNGSNLVRIPATIQTACATIAKASASGAPVQSAMRLHPRFDPREPRSMFAVHVVSQWVVIIARRYFHPPVYSHGDTFACARRGSGAILRFAMKAPNSAPSDEV